MKYFYSLLLTAVLGLGCSISASAQATNEEGDTQKFTGTLDIDMSSLGGSVVTLENQSLSITYTAEDKCSVTLFDFTFNDMVLGNIVVDDVTATTESDKVNFSGSVDGFKVGLFTVDLTCEGTQEKESGLLVMNIGVGILGMNLPVTFTGYPVAENVPVDYTGNVTFTMMGEETTVENQTIIITPDGNGKCTITLKNFSLADMSVGDVSIDDVDMTQEGDNILYSGKKDGISIANGLLTIDLDCNGVEYPDGKLTMDINVVWNGLTIPAKFEGYRSDSGINLPAADSADATPEFYTLSGIKVSDASLTPGLYIIRQGNKTYKVLINQ